MFLLEDLQMHDSWRELLQDEFKKPYMAKLNDFLNEELACGKVIFPYPEEIFAALNFTPFSDVKVVILGQDPYHGPGQAHGLAFSVKPTVSIPPSLKNIYKELESDLGHSPVDHGHLVSWAGQGVLMLNTVLTVEMAHAGSHRNKGWEKFTNKVIEILNQKKENLVFVLWGGYAEKKEKMIDQEKHLVIKAPHPSPLSAYRGFFESKPFSQINNHLKKAKLSPIDWKL